MLLVGAIGVHQLVYGLAGVVPDEHVHAYLSWLTPALFGLLFAVAGELVARVSRVHRRAAAPAPRARVLWPFLSALLIAIFAAQEAAEALSVPGGEHGHALHELVVGHGLWIVVPVSLVVGAVLALALRGAAAVEAWCLRIEPARPCAPKPYVERRRAPIAVARAPRDLLGRHLAGRAPPSVVG
ncbi:MAG TPA: hypothetical protein VF529_10340 [Solirubrobacteraceae bacterium]|jgi:hypothetical protein